MRRVDSLSQIPLDLSPTPEYSFDNLALSECNQDAVNAVLTWPKWPSPILLLVGPSGSGKTHIGQAWQKKTHATFIDDASHEDETRLFSYLNSALNGDNEGILLASDSLVSDWGIKLADLKSRLLNTPMVTLKEHDDAILEPILRKIFEDRGRQISSDLVKYMLKYCDRSIPALKIIAKDLDAAAQSQKTDLTKSFASKHFSVKIKKDMGS